MLNRFQTFIQEQAPDIISGKSLLAISGGADSVAMGHLFSMSSYAFEVMHMNFGLRGKESDEDEAFVRELCKKWNVKLHTAHPDTAAEANAHGESLQMAARRLRYDFFKHISTPETPWICTAHQQSDNLEHLFVYLLRNSPAAWQGLPIKRDNIFRPMMFATADEIRQWMGAQDLAWRSDSSNDKTDYLRNKVRHWITGEISTLMPGIEREFAELSLAVRNLRSRQVKSSQRWIEQFPVMGEGRLLTAGADRKKIFEYLQSLGMRALEADKLLKSETGSRFHFHGLMAEVRNGGIWVGRQPDHQFNETDIGSIEGLPYSIQAGKFALTITVQDNQLPKSLTNGAWYFDLSAVEFPITIHPRRKGQRMQPFGMQGSKKISDIMVDAHIAASEKDAYPVISDAAQVLGIPGIRRSSAAPINGLTKNLLVVKWQTLESNVTP